MAGPKPAEANVFIRPELPSIDPLLVEAQYEVEKKQSGSARVQALSSGRFHVCVHSSESATWELGGASAVHFGNPLSPAYKMKKAVCPSISPLASALGLITTRFVPLLSSPSRSPHNRLLHRHGETEGHGCQGIPSPTRE